MEVDPKAIKANTCNLKGLIDDNCLLMAVVKADGYGHGAETVSRAAILGGADNLGVATLQEGIELRIAGLDCEILVLGNLINIEELRACLHWGLIPTLSSFREALMCEKLAEASGRNFNVQMKFDTGMTRLGCDLKDAFSLINSIENLNHVSLKGVYSHLALADGDSQDDYSSVTALQQKRFDDFLAEISQSKLELCCHLANSAGTLLDSRLHYDMVRVGLALYGYSPISNHHDSLILKPALELKARVTLIRDVPSGVGVSYGHFFTTKRRSRLAVLGIGYADGVNRALSGKISALFQSRLIPQIGAITMDQMILDITEHPDVEVGSVVTLLGTDGPKTITAQDWSDVSGSIPWEVLCSFKHRLPRLVI